MKRTAGAWPAGATRFLALRLGPGVDLRGALEAAFAAEPEEAGFVAAAVGSLSSAHLRHAGQETGTLTHGAFEIAALSGTFSADGPHLHCVLSDPHGRVTGGHLLQGAIVRTTAEVVLALASGVRFTRPVDPETGFRELSIEAGRR